MDSDPTHVHLLEVVLRRADTEWATLYQRGKDRAMADKLARVLERSGPQAGADEVLAWTEILQHLHPGLEVKLAVLSSE